MAKILLYTMGEKSFIVDTPLLSLKENVFHHTNVNKELNKCEIEFNPFSSFLVNFHYLHANYCFFEMYVTGNTPVGPGRTNNTSSLF